MEDEAMKSRIPPNMYSLHSSGKNVSLYCRICRIRIRLLRKRGLVRVTSMENYHEHTVELLESYYNKT